VRLRVRERILVRTAGSADVRPTNPEDPVVEFWCLLERLADADVFEGRVEGPRAMLGSSEWSARRLALESLS
jgi:hypothetical protein